MMMTKANIIIMSDESENLCDFREGEKPIAVDINRLPQLFASFVLFLHMGGMMIKEVFFLQDFDVDQMIMICTVRRIGK